MLDPVNTPAKSLFMEHAFQRYWETTFADYRIESGHFVVPAFSDPLMSPRFAQLPLADSSYFNFVGDRAQIAGHAQELGFERTHSFSLGVKQLTGWKPRSIDAEVMSLEDALENPHFWEILSEGFPAHTGFLRGMLGFLPRTRARYLTTLISAEAEPAGIVTVGVCDGVALVMNAAIKNKYRGKKLCHDLVEAAAQSALALGAQEAVFWTEHEFLLKFAEQVTNYSIYQRSN